MSRLLGLTYREALELEPKKELSFQITGEKKEGINREEMRIIRVIYKDKKIFCTLAYPEYPKGVTPSF